MTRPSTDRDFQRVTFIESLHNSLKKQAKKALADHHRFVAVAQSYMQDGLEESECVELLMIDGVSREAAEGYVAMAESNEAPKEEHLPEYTFQFEDIYGKVWSSFDIGKTVRASTDEEAWTKAADLVDADPDLEPQNILSVSRIS